MRRAIAIVLVGACKLHFDAVVDGGNVARTYRETVLADGAIGYWRLGDAGSIARDETGQHDGSYTGTCGRVAGAIAWDADVATHFDGSSCKVKLADAFGFTGAVPFTVEAWIAQPAAPSTFQHVWTHETRDIITDQPSEGYAVVVFTSGIKIEREVAGGGVANLATPYSFGAFQHVVAVYDGAMVIFYVDGAMRDTAADTRSLVALSFVAEIGGTESPTMPTYGYFSGDIDEVAVYDLVLAPDHIMAHYQLGTTGPGL